MKSDEFIPWAAAPALWLAVLAMAWLASYVALDMAHRAVTNPGRAGQAWLAGGALALGTGLWSIHFVGLSGDVLPFGIGYGRLGTFAARAAAVLGSALALKLGMVRAPGWARLLAAGAVLGGVVFATLALCFVGMRISPSRSPSRWRWKTRRPR